MLSDHQAIMPMSLRVLRSILPAALLIFLPSCGSDDAEEDPYGALFEASGAAPTPSSLFGVWGGSVQDGILDIRIQFSKDRALLANRCHFTDGSTLTSGVSTSITVTDTEITVRESDDDVVRLGEFSCRASFRPATTPYAIDGTSITLGTGAESLNLVKVSD